MSAHLVVSISGHGFGHVAQTAPILNALNIHGLRITVRSSVPEKHLRSRIHAPFTLLPSEGDIGMVMSSALKVDVERSRAAYCSFHADWDARINEEARVLKSLRADLVFSNVGYLPLAGAQRAGIANAGLCSLNWADIYRHYCGENEISRQIQSCYAGADVFFRATPGMNMQDLTNLIKVAPIAATGTNQRDELNRLLGLPTGEKLLLVSMGGIAARIPIEDWPRIAGVRYLVQAGWKTSHPDAIFFDTLPMNFGDLLASVDALLCKPGYGSFVEAACCGVPVLYVNRQDWPESPALTAWLRRFGLCRKITQEALLRGEISHELEQLWQAKKPDAQNPTGTRQVADWLSDKLT